jgi:hypothetical protein
MTGQICYFFPSLHRRREGYEDLFIYIKGFLILYIKALGALLGT